MIIIFSIHSSSKLHVGKYVLILICRMTELADTKDAHREYIFAAGKSKRIWNELYKVIDSSDVILQVLDARDPLGNFLTASYGIIFPQIFYFENSEKQFFY